MCNIRKMNKWTFTIVWKALQKKQRSTNIPSKVRFGSCIRFPGNSACNSRDRGLLYLRLSVANHVSLDPSSVLYLEPLYLVSYLSNYSYTFSISIVMAFYFADEQRVEYDDKIKYNTAA